MTDLDDIIPLWQQLREAGTEYVLATVVTVEGSGYRKPGARMLIAADGRRAGTVSGGCLEGEVARKAFWHTENGPVVRRYSTSAEDGEIPFGMGCGGIVHLLLERSATAGPMMERLAASFNGRSPLAIATVLDGDSTGYRAYCAGADAAESDTRISAERISGDLGEMACKSLARQCFDEQQSFSHTIQAEDGQVATVRAEWSAARPGLFVFGAGDDAVPLVKVARQLGWYVAVADGRSHLATNARFPEAHEVHVLSAGELDWLRPQPSDAAVVMTHSMEQDGRILPVLLAETLAYIGVLGPRRRTMEMLLSIAGESGRPVDDLDAQVEAWMDRLHAPMGLDLGGDTPAEIALAIIAEIQQSRHRASGLSLRRIRARDAAILQ
jgi:xanthine dehydrogenase accessory factor